MSNFNKYSQYYDLLYKDKDYVSEVEYIDKLIKKYAPSTRSILEMGCGTGKHAILLAEKGYTIHGVDMSSSMLKQAHDRVEVLDGTISSRLAFSCGDIKEMQLEEKFDLVISLFHVISYQTSNSDIQAVFQNVKKHLKPNGVFIFDCWYGPTVLSDKPVVKIKRLEDENIKIVRITEPVLYPNDNKVDVNFHIMVQDKKDNTIEGIKETHEMRYFFKPEIEKLFTDIGFTLKGCEEWMSSKEPGIDTFGVCFIGGDF